MTPVQQILLALVPSGIVIAFIVHWIAISRLKTSREILPWCRGTYLGMSSQLVFYSWILYILLPDPGSWFFLIPLGMTASWVGDLFNLHFDFMTKRIPHPLFQGILSFMAAQVLYLSYLLQRTSLHELVTDGYLVPLVVILIIAPAIIFRFRVYNPDRPKSIMIGAFIHGNILGATTAVSLSAAWVYRGEWIITAAGFLFFLLSDAIMGETTVHGRHPRFEFQVPWITYLIAQGLIIYSQALLL